MGLSGGSQAKALSEAPAFIPSTGDLGQAPAALETRFDLRPGPLKRATNGKELAEEAEQMYIREDPDAMTLDEIRWPETDEEYFDMVPGVVPDYKAAYWNQKATGGLIVNGPEVTNPANRFFRALDEALEAGEDLTKAENAIRASKLANQLEDGIVAHRSVFHEIAHSFGSARNAGASRSDWQLAIEEGFTEAIARAKVMEYYKKTGIIDELAKLPDDIAFDDLKTVRKITNQAIETRGSYKPFVDRTRTMMDDLVDRETSDITDEIQGLLKIKGKGQADREDWLGQIVEEFDARQKKPDFTDIVEQKATLDQTERLLQRQGRLEERLAAFYTDKAKYSDVQDRADDLTELIDEIVE
jgi:hypothetical protein